MLIGNIRGWAIAYLHLTPSQFYEMRIGEFWEAMDAYWSEKRADRKHIGELVRGAALRLVNTQLKRPEKKAEKFWAMPWDDTADAEAEELRRLSRLTQEEQDKEAELFMKRIKGNGNSKHKSEDCR